MKLTRQLPLLAAHPDSNEIAEHDWSGRKLRGTTAVMNPFSVGRLKDGNTLITTNHGHQVTEVNPKGYVVWRIRRRTAGLRQPRRSLMSRGSRTVMDA